MAIDPFVASRRRLVQILCARGWLPQYASVEQAMVLLDEPTLDRAIKDAQKLTGQPAEQLDVRFCAQPDRAPVRSALCRWPQSPPQAVTWNTEGGVANVSAIDLKYFAELVSVRIMSVCGIKLAYTANPKTANIWIHGAKIDGPFGVLADCRLPCSLRDNDAQMELRLDAETWNSNDVPPANAIALAAVLCHEWLHGLGLDHGPNGCLMAPVYSRQIYLPQTWDIAELVKRYGPKQVDVPAPPPVGGKRFSLIVTSDSPISVQV